jgi:hypothetical protein
MAVPGLSEVATMTLRNRTRRLADNVSRNNAILTRLNSKGNVRPFSGGRTIVCELEYANNQTYQRYSGYQTLNISPSVVFSAAEYPIRQIAVVVSISGLEQLQNAGREQSIALLESRINNAEKTFKNGFSYDLYSDGSITGQVNGLQALLTTSPSTGTIGGIDRSAWGFWRNYAFSASTDGGAAVSPSNVHEYFLQIWQNTTRAADRPDLILADNSVWSAYYRSLVAIQRLTASDSDVGKAGFSSLKFMDADVVMDGGYQGSTLDGNNFGASGAAVVGGAPSASAFFVNTEYLYLRPHSQMNMDVIDPASRSSVNQDAMVKIIGWAGNVCVSNMFLQGRLYT